MTKIEQLRQTIAKQETILAGLSPEATIRPHTERALAKSQAELDRAISDAAWETTQTQPVTWAQF